MAFIRGVLHFQNNRQTPGVDLKEVIFLDSFLKKVLVLTLNLGDNYLIHFQKKINKWAWDLTIELDVKCNQL